MGYVTYTYEGRVLTLLYDQAEAEAERQREEEERAARLAEQRRVSVGVWIGPRPVHK